MKRLDIFRDRWQRANEFNEMERLARALGRSAEHVVRNDYPFPELLRPDQIDTITHLALAAMDGDCTAHVGDTEYSATVQCLPQHEELFNLRQNRSYIRWLQLKRDAKVGARSGPASLLVGNSTDSPALGLVHTSIRLTAESLDETYNATDLLAIYTAVSAIHAVTFASNSKPALYE